MKLNLSRRDFHLAAANMLVASSAGSLLLGASSPAFAQSRSVKLGTFGAIDAQNYIRAKNMAPKTFGPSVASDFVTVRAGSEVISAMAGGSLDMCNIGSSPMMVGYANGLKASMVYVYKNIVDSECLVVQGTSGITNIAGLKGKKIGLPFNTSVHFAAIAALKTAGLGINDVQLINMRADQIASAWQRREIDASYIWVPVLPRLTEDGGKIIFKTGDLNQHNLLIFDALLVRDEFKQKSPDLVLAFLKEYEQIARTFKQDPKEVVETMTKFLNVDEAAVMRSLNTFYPVPASEQLSSKWMGKPGEKDTGVIKTLQTQAQFLFESGQITAMPKDVAGLVDQSFVAKMVA
ncbi:ABC transporter substrate-binding protein [Variovorax robiniae]|uniref:ABC transporter substrate-binding protein n=1 Tax=Variovorax robiniae TaxID=1836199 RepID=A0ABU8XDB0_9BURK